MSGREMRSPKEHHRDGPCRDLKIEREACISHIPDIESRLVFRRNIPASHDLRPAGETRADKQPGPVFVGLIAGQKRPRTNDGHFAMENIEQLRQLIEPQAAHDGADAGNPFRVGKPSSIGVMRRSHGAEFVKFEGSATEPWALLPEQDRRTHGCGHKKRGGRHKRQADDERSRCGKAVDGSFRHPVSTLGDLLEFGGANFEAQIRGRRCCGRSRHPKKTARCRTIKAQVFSKELKRNGAGPLHTKKGIALTCF